MLKTRIIPVLLLKGWNLVKSQQFSTIRTVGNPIQHVKVFNARNVDELVLLDIYATKHNTKPQYEIIADLARECFMPLSVGGGITNTRMIRQILLAGADKVIMNSYAFDNPDFITKSAQTFGSQAIIVSIDVKKEKGKYYVYTHGGSRNTKCLLQEWIKEAEKRGAGEIVLTAIERDGMMNGYDTDLIQSVSRLIHIPVVAVGGAGKEEDFVLAIRAGADAVGAASIFLYTQITPNKVKQLMKDNGIQVRI